MEMALGVKWVIPSLIPMKLIIMRRPIKRSKNKISSALIYFIDTERVMLEVILFICTRKLLIK